MRSDAEVLLESVLSTAKGFLGGAEILRSIGVEVFEAEGCAVVWAELRSEGLDQELQAMESFFEVQDCFAGELTLELRFGDMMQRSERAAAAKTLVLSR